MSFIRLELPLQPLDCVRVIFPPPKQPAAIDEPYQCLELDHSTAGRVTISCNIASERQSQRHQRPTRGRRGLLLSPKAGRGRLKIGGSPVSRCSVRGVGASERVERGDSPANGIRCRLLVGICASGVGSRHGGAWVRC